MYRTVQIKNRRYRVNVERFADFCGAVLCGVFALAAFVFFFGACWGGFLR